MLNQPLSKKRKRYELLLKALMPLATGLTAALVLFLLLYTILKGIPNITWELLSTKPSYLEERIGILPDILNTIYRHRNIDYRTAAGCGRRHLLDGIRFQQKGRQHYRICRRDPFRHTFYHLWPGRNAAFFEQHGHLPDGGCIDPGDYEPPNHHTHHSGKSKDRATVLSRGCICLGAGKWRVVRTVVLPGCVDGVITGCILSIGRILGESAALLFTAGFAHAVNGIIEGLAAPGATLSVALYVYAKEQGEFGVAFAIAAILMVLTVAINFATAFVQKLFAARRS